MQTCQVCGKQNPAGVEYCEDCGAALTGAGQAAGAGSAQAIPVATPAAQDGGTSIPITAPAPATTGAGVTPPGPEAGTGGGAPAGTPAAASGGTASPTGTNGAAVEGAGATGTLAPADSGAAPTGTTPPAAEAAGASAPAPAPAGTDQRARLLVKRFGAATGDEIPLLAQRLLVGRFDPETGPVDVDLSSAPEAEHVSRQHGELYREADGSWFVRDLGSTNGVFVKGEGTTGFGPRITAPRALGNGDEIAFGNARFVFRTD